jgi:CubicO group peptidase (beta-lactamase class C family)
MEIHGHCDDRFSGVLKAFENNFENNGDIGACFAATLEGEYVVDIWAGHQDKAKTRPWQEDTIINVYSTTKTMTFIVALMLADRGELDLNAPVVKYWPEFAANGTFCHTQRVCPVSAVPSLMKNSTTGILLVQIWRPRKAGGKLARRAVITQSPRDI